MIKFSSYLSPRRLAIVDAPDKRAAILRVLELLRGWPQISDHERFVREVLAREAMMPTNLNLGIGVPHARSATVREPIAALGVLSRPVAYGGASPAPVGIIVAIGMPQDANDNYLRYLARISCVFGKEENRLAVQACRTADDLCRLVSQF